MPTLRLERLHENRLGELDFAPACSILEIVIG
jgi:hypothetical protein